ncbi:hydroxymethylglutaryl-CoA lyase [Alteromonas sp. KUL49]|uniref:hydroxymethylglutaryl-CoA lyase n=1 Tax=Alteromonas sp. KUL49 TaxID=2480798 RepID=UPI00102ED61C|nr:hydroxymethylglutaryl-CoA lyase [Alteromonas sp. KUL49]TAP38654.1 hydroxymethylglutaryl-CoA lyase [Alteromonas sp. KUL49]GEA12599.1 hydroxymethylglutaryl-CoA lyase [Alteromonas sp. KUL49]
MTNQIVINDVGPRDGLQNQPKTLSIEERVSLITALVEAGLPAIEVGAFVSPKAVPAMAGTDEVFAQLPKDKGVNYSALIPNARGFETGVKLNVPLMSLVVAASSTMNEKNIRMTTAQSMSMSSDVLGMAKELNRNVQAYVATAWECPFEGIVQQDEVLKVTDGLIKAGASHIVVADTIGAAAPDAVHSLMSKLAAEFGADKLSCHFHDTRAMGVANVYAAIEAGIRQFDASIGGLGGCPFAPGATGNVATEDIVLLIEQMGFETGINMSKLLEASDLATELTGTARGGHAKAWLKQQK